MEHSISFALTLSLSLPLVSAAQSSAARPSASTAWPTCWLSSTDPSPTVTVLTSSGSPSRDASRTHDPEQWVQRGGGGDGGGAPPHFHSFHSACNCCTKCWGEIFISVSSHTSGGRKTAWREERWDGGRGGSNGGGNAAPPLKNTWWDINDLEPLKKPTHTHTTASHAQRVVSFKFFKPLSFAWPHFMVLVFIFVLCNGFMWPFHDLRWSNRSTIDSAAHLLHWFKQQVIQFC